MLLLAGYVIFAGKWWAGAPVRMVRWWIAGVRERRRLRTDREIIRAYDGWLERMRQPVPGEVRPPKAE